VRTVVRPLSCRPDWPQKNDGGSSAGERLAFIGLLSSLRTSTRRPWTSPAFSRRGGSLRCLLASPWRSPSLAPLKLPGWQASVSSASAGSAFLWRLQASRLAAAGRDRQRRGAQQSGKRDSHHHAV